MIHSTTILAVRHRDRAVLAGDGQVTFGQTVVKQRARKIRRLYNERILAGFAGSAADSFALFARFEAKLEQYRGNLERSAVELAKDWRSDRILRRLEAMHPRRPSVILLDMMMPYMNGLEFCARQRTTPELANIPIIAITGAGISKQDLGAVGVHRAFSKPLNLANLMQAIRRICPPPSQH